ncbi:alpha/beta hydrolase [Flavobacterium sp.]|jgi:predicted alpha/beta superfamily hydrolase|uniref:alpha/beta hydrolase n=1 Tax=Flavobacterium sp. TaxID=239 RepID=UPI0037C19BE5
MKNFIFILISLITLDVFSQKTVELFDSKKLGEEREITVSLPKSYEKETKRKYPLLVLLDGDYLYSTFQGTLTYGNYWDDLPEVIIVAVTQNKNDERYEDCQWDEKLGLPIDKGKNFFEFLAIELMPYIEKSYRIAPFKIIAGHDTTAGFSNLYLYKDDPVFDAYISLSPDLPTEMENLLPLAMNQINKPIFFYLATADGDIKKLQTKIKKLNEGLVPVENPLFNYKFDDFKGATHYSLVLQGVPSALYQIFAVYQPISSLEYQEKLLTMESGQVQYLIDKYETIEKTLNIKMPMRLSDFKAIESAVISKKDYNALDELSIVAEKQYPKSMLHDYYMALMYEKKGLYEKAKKNYLSAMQKEPIGDLNKDSMYEKAEQMKSMPAE